MSYENANYLAHHGIKGQKWGIRRFQNEDGSYTQEGKKRLGRGQSSKPESATWKKRESRYLSDEELVRRNQRLNKENSYRDNVEKNHPVRKEIKNYAKQIIIGTAVTVAASALKTRLSSTAPVEFIKKCANYKLPL